MAFGVRGGSCTFAKEGSRCDEYDSIASASSMHG